MSFLEARSTEADEPEPVWPTLGQTKQDEVVMLLARLIASAVAQERVVEKEERDE